MADAATPPEEEEPWEGAGEAESDSGDQESSSEVKEEVLMAEDDFGLNFGPPLQPVHCWKKLSSCEEFVGAKRSKHTIVAWNEKLYVFGGDNGRRMLNDFLVSHIRDSSWARVVFTGEPRSLSHSTVYIRVVMREVCGY